MPFSLAKTRFGQRRGFALRATTGGAPPPTPFVQDTFTDTAGVALQSHTVPTGGPWVRHTLSGAGNIGMVGTGDRARTLNGSLTLLYYATATPPTAQYDVQCDFIMAGAPVETSGICGRMDTAAHTLYIVRYLTSTTEWQLAKIVAGTLTQLSTTFPQVLTAGQSYTVKLEIRDAAKKVFVDGVERISSTDNAITGVGRAGFRTFASGTPTDILSIQFDNFSAVAA